MIEAKAKIQKNDRLSFKLSGLDYGGYAYGKVQNNIIYVPRGAPGDLINGRIKKIRHNFCSAELLTILKPSADRVETNCRFFKEGCGGCQWLHIKYPVQLLWKKRILIKMFLRQAGVKLDIDQICSISPNRAYRNKLSLIRNAKGQFGLMKENSRELIEIDKCLQELEVLNKILRQMLSFKLPLKISQIHLRANRKNQASLLFYAEEYNPQIAKITYNLLKEIPSLISIGLKIKNKYFHLGGQNYLSEKIANNLYLFPPISFFQTNYEQAEVLLKKVIKLIKAPAHSNILDLHCGVGFFSIELAKHFSHVVGIEACPQSVQAAKLNANLNKRGNLNFIKGNAEKVIRQFKRHEFETIVLDPPRNGCGELLLKQISRLSPNEIIYISCAPDKLANECKFLFNESYKISNCLIIDMFPQTYHVEVVLRLTKS